MQRKPRSQNPKSLYSKFKEWCLVHDIPTIMFPLIIIGIVGILGLVIGALILDWDLLAVFVSPTATVVYAFIVILICGVLYRLLMRRLK